MVRCFDDAEIIHIEGDVDPCRDLDIIANELRIKDTEFVEKAHENLVKQTRRGGQSLEMRKLMEEQATVEKILQMLKEGKDVRKGDWSAKEVSSYSTSLPTPHSSLYMMTKSLVLDIIPALRMASFQSHVETILRRIPTLIKHYRHNTVKIVLLANRTLTHRCDLGRGDKSSIPLDGQARRISGEPV